MSKYRESFGGDVFALGSRSGAKFLGCTFAMKGSAAELFKNLGEQSLVAIGRALDEVGGKTKTQVVRAVAKQAGVKYGRALDVIGSNSAFGAGNGEYRIIARDVTLSLKEFDPRRTSKGVSAAPWGKRRVFPHTFIGPNGHVFVRQMQGGHRARRLPIHKLFGPAIPKEMVQGEAEKVFYDTAEKLLPAAVEKWLIRQMDKK